MRKRSGKTRNLKTTVLLVTNGEKTEHDYLEKIRDYINAGGKSNYSTKVKFVAGDPTWVIKQVISPKGDLSDYDQVWIVVDKDDNQSSKMQEFIESCHEESRRKSRGKDNQNKFVHAVISNPCFEVWLVAHYERVRNYQNQNDAKRHYEQKSGVEKDCKILPDDFPFEKMQEAKDQAHLTGSTPLELNEEGNSPATAMPHLLSYYKLVS